MRIPRRFGKRFLGGAAAATATLAAVCVPLTLGAGAPSGATAVGTVTWSGNGTTNGQCDNMNEGLTGVPDNEQGWLFILTSPGTGPWTLTTSFSPDLQPPGGPWSGTQEGGGSVHFVAYSPIGATLQSASAVTGTDNSNLTVSGCTDGNSTTTTTTTTTSTTTTTTTVPDTTTTTTTAPTTTTTGPTSSGLVTSPTSAPTTTTTQPATKAAIAFTGADIGAMGAAGMALVGLGVGLVAISRRRHEQGQSS